MRIGLSTATYFGKLLTEDALSEIKAMGAPVCEVFLTTYSEYGPEFAEVLRPRAEGIDVQSIHTLNTNFEPQLYNRAERTFRDAEELFRKTLDTARKLKASCYTFHGVARLKKKAYDLDYAAVGERTNRLIAICAEYGVSLCYENVHWAYYAFPGFFRELSRWCPDLCACLDIKQAMQSGEDYKKYLDDMGDRLRTVHICDYDENGKLTLPGKGIFPFKELFSILRDYPKDLPVLLELYSDEYRDLAEVRNCYHDMCELAGL